MDKTQIENLAHQQDLPFDRLYKKYLKIKDITKAIAELNFELYSNRINHFTLIDEETNRWMCDCGRPLTIYRSHVLRKTACGKEGCEFATRKFKPRQRLTNMGKPEKKAWAAWQKYRRYHGKPVGTPQEFIELFGYQPYPEAKFSCPKGQWL